MRNVIGTANLGMMVLMMAETDANNSGTASGTASDAVKTEGTEGTETKAEDKPAEAGDREKDEFFGSELQKASVTKAVEEGNIKLIPQQKTQKTRGKGSRELTFKWDDVVFVNTDGVLAFVGGDEQRLLDLLSDVASDMNQQAAWEALFGLSDDDKLIRQAAKRIAQVLGISEAKAEEQVRAMVAEKAKETAAVAEPVA